MDKSRVAACMGGAGLGACSCKRDCQTAQRPGKSNSEQWKGSTIALILPESTDYWFFLLFIFSRIWISFCVSSIVVAQLVAKRITGVSHHTLSQNPNPHPGLFFSLPHWNNAEDLIGGVSRESWYPYFFSASLICSELPLQVCRSAGTARP